MQEENETIKHLMELMKKKNSVDSYGAVVLRNGMIVQILNNAEIIDKLFKNYLILRNDRTWKGYRKLKAFIKGIDGYVCDGSTTIPIEEIVCVVVTSRFDTLSDDLKNRYYNKMERNNDFLELVLGFEEFITTDNEEGED